jgi:transposase
VAAAKAQGIDVFVEMPVGQLGVEIEQIGIGFYAVHATGSDQTCEPCPTTGAFIVPCKKRVTARHGWASDRIFDQVGIHVDMAILKEHAKALLSPEHVAPAPTAPIASTPSTDSITAQRVDITLSDGRRILVEGPTALSAIVAMVSGLAR